MIKHKKVYLDALNLKEGDFVECELTGGRATDIHHIECRGMGGTSNKHIDSIENLMALRRDVHDLYGDKTNFMAGLLVSHWNFLHKKGVEFDRERMREKIRRYENIRSIPNPAL